MSDRPWQGALIGCGFFAPNHLHAWWSTAGVEIVAVCDRELPKAKSLAEKFGISATYDDVVKMLDRERLDFVDIATTAPSHRGLVELCSPHVRLISCQKPFAENLVDADAMVSACEHAKVPLVIHENFRWQRPFRELAGRLDRGTIGQRHSLRLTFRHLYDIYSNQPYLARTERLALMDVGLHLFDLARVLMGDVVSIHCRTQRLNPAVRGEDAFLALLQHRDGAVSMVDCSFFSHSHAELFPQTLALIEGSEGSLELAPGYQLIEKRGNVIEQVSAEPEVPEWGAKPWHAVQDSVIRFQSHVIDVLEGRARPRPSGADSRKTLALVLAAYASAEHGTVIEIPPEVGL